MIDIFVNSATGGLAIPDAGTAMRRAGGEWQETGSPGFRAVPLLDDPSTGLRTLLMEFEAGSYAGTHSHAELEQVYVLQGEMYDDDTIYGAGDFLVRAPGEAHLAGSREGATVLITYIPVETRA